MTKFGDVIEIDERHQEMIAVLLRRSIELEAALDVLSAKVGGAGHDLWQAVEESVGEAIDLNTRAYHIRFVDGRVVVVDAGALRAPRSPLDWKRLCDLAEQSEGGER